MSSASRIVAPPLPEHHDRIRDVSVVTCNRPRLLARCLLSLRSHADTDGAAVRVRILDDGANANPLHVDHVARRAIAHRLARAAGVDERLATFALSGLRSAGPTVGAVRNTSLILNAGRKHLQVDDDAICTPYVSGAADERRVELLREDSHIALQWHVGRADPLVGLQPARDSFIAAHERILGRTLAAVALENDFRVDDRAALLAGPSTWAAVTVRLTQNSLLGDCGVVGPWWKTVRSTARTRSQADSYESELLSREVVRKVDAIAVSRRLATTGFAMGIDGTRLVPPFLPCGRGEDAIFVYLLNLMDERAYEAQLPAIVEHRPDERAPFRRSEILSSVANLSVPSLLHLLCCVAPIPRGAGEATLRGVGRSLLHSFRRGWHTASEELVPRLVALRRSMVENIQSVLDGAPDMPDARRADLCQQAAALRTSIQQASRRSLIEDIAASQPELCSEAAIVQFLTLFGELLQVWSCLWTTASCTELENADA